MGKYQAYPEYRGSNLPWLGEIPSHWQLLKAKYLFRREQRGYDSDAKVVTAFRDGQVTLRINRRTDGFTESLKEIGYQGVKKGDLLVHAMDGFAGAIGVSDSDGKCSPVCSVCSPINPRKMSVYYYGYLVRQLAVTNFIASLAKGIRERSTEFRYGEFAALELAVPPVAEQQKIAAFLDHETAKIDALIEKQQQLIQLLKEKRQAVISHAVTKGLTPNAPMKDSGIEWLGEVPAHWEVSRVGWLCEFISYGFTNPMPSTDEGPYMLTATDIEFGRVKYEEARRTSLEAFRNLLSPKSIPCAGDVLVTKDGTLGRVAVFDGENVVCISQSVALLRLQKKLVLPEFLAMAFSGADYQSKMIFDAGGTTIKHIYISILAKMNFVLPPIHEQKIIIDELRLKLADMDRLIDHAINASSLLNERRTALISAAVTGKIDVRDFVVPA